MTTPIVAEPRSVAAIMEAESKARKERAAVTLERMNRENLMMKTRWCQQLKLACQYLGLRPAKRNTGNESYTNMMSNDINTTEAGPSSTESKQEHVIFLAIEISKSAPRGQNKKKKITEIGISTLATSDLLIGRARGEAQVEVDRVKEKIRTRNFRIKEWSNLQETDLVQGYGDTFKKELGSSEWISVHSAPKLIASCFGHDTSSNPAITPPLGGSSSSSASVDDNNNKSYPAPTNKSGRGVIVPEEEKKCDNIIVVGHRVEKKISDLKDIIGFDVTKLGNVIKDIDVQDMFRALQQNPKTRTLHSILQELDKPIQTNANPGNDSNCTLQAMIHICLKSCDANYRSKMVQERIHRMEEKANQKIEDVREEQAEWDQVEGDDYDDGGEPVPIKEFIESKKKKKLAGKIPRSAKISYLA